jgi:predicted amidohydrolase
MWENALYVGGDDDGVMDAGGLTAGAAVCWELMRSQTARRLRGRVDVVVGGSCWWSVPAWPPRALSRRWEQANARTAGVVAERFARLVGAPVVHAAHAGGFDSASPWMPVRYRGFYEGGAVIADADGRVLARRDRDAGAGFAIADVEPGRRPPLDAVPDRFWIHKRGPAASVAWNVQRLHGRRWYRRHVAGRPPLVLERGRAGTTPAA